MSLVKICSALAFCACASHAMADMPPPPGSPYPSKHPALAAALDSIPRFATDAAVQVDGNRASARWLMPDGVICAATLTFSEPKKSQMELDYDRDIRSGKMRSPPLIPFPVPAWHVDTLSCQGDTVKR